MVLMYEEEELYSGLEGGEGERDQAHGYFIQDLLQIVLDWLSINAMFAKS